MAMLTLADADKWMKANGYDTKPQMPESEQTENEEEWDYRKIPYLGQFVGHTADAATQGVADVFQAIGLESAGNYLNEQVKESSARLPEMRKPEMSLDYILDPNGLTSATAQVVGSMLPMAAGARFVPGGVGAMAGRVASKVPVVGGLLGKNLPGAVQWGLGSTPVEALMEKGGTERDLLEQGYSREEAQSRSNDVFLKNLALLAATNTAEGLFAGRLLKGINASKLGGTMAGRLGGFAGSAAGETALNAFEEGEQQGFQDMAMGKEASYNPLNWNPEQMEAAKFGVAGMAPLTLLGLPASLRGSRRAEETAQSEIDDTETPVADSAGSGDVDTFMSAIMGQESGGNYDAENVDTGAAGAFQIMPENWPSWAENAGLGADAPMTPENQNYVARQKMLEYYNQFGNWRDVAIAWYGGPGAVEWSDEAKSRPQVDEESGNVYPSVNEYADSVMERMGNPSSGMGSQAVSPVPSVSPIDYQSAPASDLNDWAWDKYNGMANDVASGKMSPEEAQEKGFDFFGGIVGEYDQTGELSGETRQQIADEWGDDFAEHISSKKPAAETEAQAPASNTPRTFQTGPSQNQAPIPRKGIETPNLETLQAAQRYGLAGGLNQDLTKQQPVSSRLFQTGPNDANNKAAKQQVQAVNNAVQMGQYNPDLTRNTVNDVVQQLARQEAARQSARTAPSQNLPALLPMLPPGQSQQQAQPTIQTPTGGQMAATTADAIAGQQQAAPQLNFAGRPQNVGLQNIIQQIMERGNQNAQNQISSAAPAPEVYQAGNNQNPNVEPQTGTAAGAENQKNQVSTLDAPIPGSPTGMTYRQYADLAARRGGRLETEGGQNRIAFGDFGNEIVPQEVADYFKKAKTQVREKSAQTPDDGRMAWIAQHPFRYDASKSLDENVADAKKLAGEYLKKFGETYKINSPERQELRQRVANQLYGNGAERKEGKVWLVLGLPGAGKSTIAKPLAEREGAYLLDADEAKRLLPEFGGGVYEDAVHKESTNISHEVLRTAIHNNDNIVWTTIGNNPDSLQDKINRFKEAGYEVNLVYVDLPVSNAAERARNRFRDEGRLFPEDKIKAIGTKPKENYDAIKRGEEVNSYEAWDNNVGRGVQPIRIEFSAESAADTAGGQPGDGGRRRAVRYSDGQGDSVPQGARDDSGEVNTDADESRSGEQGGFSDGDEDFHGFPDGKSAYAQRLIRDALSAKVNPFGDAKGLMSVKKMMESLAKESAQATERNGKYYINGNKVSKAAYKYFNYLREIGYGREKSAQEPAENKNAVPQTEATAKNGRFRIKYKNGEITISLIPTKYHTDGDTNATVKLDWGKVKEILNSNMYAEEMSNTLSPFIKKLGLDPEERGYYGGHVYWPELYEALRSLKGKVDSAVRLQENTPKIQERMKKLLEDRDVGAIVETLRTNDNKVSIKAFSDITGVDLSPVMKTRMEQVKDYFGEEYTKWEESEKKAKAEKEREKAAREEQERKNKLEKAEKDWNAGETVSGRDFASLCDKYEVNIPLATKGVLFNKIDGIDNKGTLHGARKLKKYPQGLAEVYRKLTEAMKEQWASEDEIDHFFGKEKARENSAQSNFTTGDHTHTKTGEKIPMAKFNERVDMETYKSVRAIAKRHGGNYSRFAKKFLFKTEESRDAFVRDADELLNGRKNREREKSALAVENPAEIVSKMPKATNETEPRNSYFADKFESAVNESAVKNITETSKSSNKKKESEPAASNKENEESIFGSVEDADKAMFEALGISPDDAANEEVSFSNEFGDTTDEEIEALKKELSRELNKLSANPFFNPRVYSLGLQLGGKYIQKGYRTFKAWVDKMRGDLGEGIEPWAPAIWETLKTYPKGVKFDPKQAMAISRAIGARYERGTTDLDAIEKDITKGMSAANKKTFAPVIEASYNGIKKFFDGMGGAENAGIGQTDEGRTGDEGERFEGVETVSSGNERGRTSVDERAGADESPDRRVEEAPSENGEAVSENGDTEGVRSGVSGETGRRENEAGESGIPAAGRERGSEQTSDGVAGGNGRAGGRRGQQHGGSVASDERADDGGKERGVRAADREALVNNENYHIDDPNALFGGTPKVRFSRNKQAIEIFQQLEAERRNPTQEEKDAMAAFTGWGSFGQQLFQGTYENPKPQEGWEKESEWLRDTLGKEDWEAAQKSIINAHYTSPVVVKSLWDMARRMGFKGGRVLEPSMGVGNFFGMMPKDIEQGSTLFGVEMDSVTGGIAKMLYPKAKIQISPYQNVQVADGTYDLIVGNVPFADISPADRRYDKFNAPLHDYFFLKGIDELRSGGIMMAITSKGTMDKINRGVRMELAKKAELVDAYRFPTGAFGEYAGTDVVTDVLIFKKREKPIIDVSGEEWIGTTQHEVEYNYQDYTYNVNNFFENHPEKVLGKIGFGRATGKAPGLSVTMDTDNFQKQLDDMAKSVAGNVYEEPHYDKNLQYVSNNENDRMGTLQDKNGKLYVATGVDSAPIEAFKEWKLPSSIKNKDTIKARLDELKDLVKLRKAYAKLEDAEKNDAPNMEKLRKELKKVYDAHIAKYCMDENGKPLMVEYTTYNDNNKKVKKKRPKLLEDTAGLKLFEKAHEPNYFNLCALQQKNGQPATILTERVMRTTKKDITNPSIQEALMIQRNQSMRIDVDEIAKLSKKSKKEVLKELNGYLFKTPNGDYQVKDQYLSGNVRRKLREAKAALANGDKDMEQNIEALQKVMPEDIPYYNISVGFGGTWIDIPYYKEFIADLVGAQDAGKVDISRNQSGQWKVTFTDKSLNNSAGATTTYGVSEVKFDRLLTHALNHTKPTITYKDSEGHTHNDDEAMQKAVEQMEKIRETFGDWLWKDEKRKTELSHAYNEVMNNTATPTYDGSFLDMAGMMLKRGDKPFNLRQHQINAIYRGLVNGSGIYAHEVGTGKTYTMGGLAMEARRFGIAKKPLILAHNANSKTVASDIQEMYPGAKVLYISGDSSDVKKDLMRVKNDDWDVVVMPHSKTEKLTLTEKTLEALSADLIAELEDDAIEAAKADGVDLTTVDIDDEKEVNKIRSQTAKDLVKQRLRILENIRKNAFKASAEDAIPFEDLGIDMIIVDESHVFKKPPFSTRMNVKGLQKQTSDNSIQLYYLSQYVQGMNNGKGVHLFTGTPITNTVVEMYHNMKYVMPNEMKEAGVFNFDDWFNTFSQVTSNMEYSSTGEVENVDRLNAFVNVAELRRMVGQYMDIVFAEDMPEFEPRKTESGKALSDKNLTAEERDYLINGRDENAVGLPYVQTINEVIPMNDAQKNILSMFMGYAKQWRDLKNDKKARRNIMKEQLPQSPLYTEGSVHKAAMDARLYNPNVNVTGMDSKEARVIKNIMSIYNMDPRATQCIMMEQGKSDSSKQIPRDENGYPIGGKDDKGRFIKEDVKTYNLLKGIKAGLIEAGIPEKEIAVVDGTTKPDKKGEIAEKVKHGEIRVVIGSTSTLGTGVNMQDNLKAIHHIDAPWMPGDLEQRNGRIVRQGNKWNTVLEYRYITEKLDGRRWQVLSTKKKFIKMFMKADEDLRVLDGDAVDVGDSEGGSSDFEETLSKATGDPRFLRKANLEETVKKLEKSRASFVAGIEDAKYKLRKLNEGGLETLETNVRTLKSMQDKYAAYKTAHPDTFEITIGKKKYTDRKDVDAAIKDAFDRIEQIGQEVKIGEFAGLNLYGVMQRNTDFSGSYSKRIRITDGTKTVFGFDCADTVGGITQKLANIGKAIDREQSKLTMAENDIKTLEKQIKGTFPREDVLNAKKKELKALEKDLLDNPVPPPQWLVEGAPVMSDVIVDGKKGTVETYRVEGTKSVSTDNENNVKTEVDYSNPSFYVGVKLEGSDETKFYPWQDVQDAQGLPMITAPEGVKKPGPYAEQKKAEEKGGESAPETQEEGATPRISFSVDARIPHQAGSGTTQVAGTKSMYVKALHFLRLIKENIKSVLDYGADLGLGTDEMRKTNKDLKIDSFEPDPTRWKGETAPTYTDNTKIKGKYDAILNTNVLNVVEPEIRDAIVKNIASLLEKDGVALITTRGWKGDIALNKNYEAGTEPKSMWVNKTVDGKPIRVYQKGFDGNELLDYVSSLLGDGYDVRKMSGFGKSAVVVRKKGGAAKLSASGEMTEAERMRSEARELSRDEWTPKQKKIADFGEQMGVPVVFIDGDPRLHGYHENGVTYLNVNSEIPIHNVFWHESFHWMRNNNPELYSDLIGRMQELDIFSEDDIESYRESIGRPELTNEEAVEEMLADAMMDKKQREDIMQNVAKSDKNLIERFVAWLRETMKAFQDFMKNPEAGLTRAKIAAMNNELARFLRRVEDGNGNRIFSVTPKGEIRKFGGAPLPAMAYSVDSSGENRDNVPGSDAMENKKSASEGGKVSPKAAVISTLNKIIGQDIVNRETGITAKIGRRGINEMVSNRAVNKSVSNGYSQSQHLQAAGNIKALFEEARLTETRPDRINDSNVVSMKIFHCATYVEDEKAVAKITVKESVLHGHRIYSVELEQLEKPTELKKRTDTASSVGLEGSTQQGKQASAIYAEEPSSLASTVPQGQGKVNGAKFSVNLGNKGRPGNQGGLSRGAKTASFMGIIRNKLAGIVGDGSVRVRKEMKDALEKAAGVAIRAGHIDSMTNVKTEGGVIRTRNAYDWENILPEAGKMIAKRLGLGPSDKMGDYIAKWILDGALNDTSQEAADFQRAMRKHPELQDQILDAHDIFQEWNNMDADKRIEASVQWTPRGTLERLLLGDTTIKDELAAAQKVWYDEWIEELGSLGRMEENIEKKTGKKISRQDSALRAFRLLRGATGKFMTMIEGKDAQAVEAIKSLFPNVDFEGFKTLRMILDDAGVRQDKEGMRQFMTYCIAKHSMTIHKKNEDLELEQLNLERKLKQAKTEKEKAELRAQIVELGQQIMQAPNTRKDAEATIAKFAKRFGKAQQDLVRFSRVTMDIMVDSGLMSEDRRDEMAKAWPDYVPFFRVFDENEDVQFGDSLKHVSGSKRDLVNPLESIIKNTFEFVRRAEKNKAKLKIANLAKMSDVGEYIQLVDAAKPEDKTVLDYYEDGKKKFIQTDPTVVTAIRNMGLQSSTMFSRMLRFPAQIARAAFTMVNPSFALRNVLRDSADAYLYSKYGYNPLKDFARGFMHAIKQDEMYYEWMASGAAQASMISLDRDYTQSAINNITRTWQERLVHNPLDLLQIAGEYSEYATRIGAYERAKNEIIKRDATISAMGAITEAAFESRDLMDFSRGGKSSRAMNQLIIFSNASIQGWDKFFRTFDFRKDKKAAMAALARLAISAILPSIALFMLNYDKDWWKEIPDWQKEKHWIIKVGDTILRIPKGQDPGIQFFSNLVEKGMGAMVNKDPIKFNRVVRPLWNTMPDFLPTAFMPFIEVGANYSFFTERNIVPQYQKKLPEKMQYGPHTSSFAKWLGERIGVAPSHIDHIIAGYGGNLARGAFNVYDQFAGNQPLNTAKEEMPIISGLTIMPYKNPKSVQEYYEKLDEQEKLYNEYKMTRVRPDGFDPALYGRMKKARTSLQKLSKMERSLMNNPHVSLSDRKARQEQIQARRIEIIKRAMGR